jgi:hypothetical protein
MRILFQSFPEWIHLGRILRADGWVLEAGRHDGIVAEHPHVPDEAAARSRLDRLGLLTARRLRIEFLLARRSSG